MATKETSRPSWQVEPCPAWCSREHHEDDHPDDRQHTDGVVVPIVRRATMLDESNELVYTAVSCDLCISLTADLHLSETWARIGEAEGVTCIELSIGSLRRLCVQLSEVVASAR